MQKAEFDYLLTPPERPSLHDYLRQPREWPMIANLREMNPGELKSLHELPTEEAREIIKQHEKPMSDKLRTKIHQYIARRRKAGDSEKAIAKGVKKKFLIEVF